MVTDYDPSQLPDWVHQVQQQHKDEAARLLIPTGRYDGQLIDSAVRLGADNSPYAGKEVTRVTMQLFSVEGKERKFSFDAIDGAYYMQDGRLRQESVAAGDLIIAAKTKSLADAISALMGERLQIHITLSGEKGDYPAKNWVRSIKRA